MWRVLLSVFAAGFDGLMIAIFALVLPTVLNPPAYHVPAHAAVAGAATLQARQLGVIIALGFIIGGFVLNLLAIAFGARLRLGRAAARSAVAAEFA